MEGDSAKEGWCGVPRRSKSGQAGLAAKALIVHERLCALYECPIPYFHDLDPLSELISSSLSHRTKNRDSGRAFKALRARFATWEAVRDAPTGEVEEAISACTWPELKAPRIQAILRMVGERVGRLSLDFLGEMSVGDARAWLEALPGVGPKTSAAVLSFSTLRKAALPVDSHHHRVAVRVGLVASGVGPGAAHEILAGQLPAGWGAQAVYDNHEVMMIHGQRCCFPVNPACERCALVDVCPEGQRRVHGRVVEVRGEEERDLFSEIEARRAGHPGAEAERVKEKGDPDARTEGEKAAKPRS